jgi:hypothetical protein
MVAVVWLILVLALVVVVLVVMRNNARGLWFHVVVDVDVALAAKEQRVREASDEVRADVRIAHDAADRPHFPRLEVRLKFLPHHHEKPLRLCACSGSCACQQLKGE